MARIALIKLFTGLNLATAQLSAELQRAGHDSRVINFKDHHIVNYDKKDEYEVTDYPGVFIAANGTKKIWNCYRPFTEKEFRLLIEDLKEFQPDAIGFNVLSGNIKEVARVNDELKKHFDIPFIWGGYGPTLEPDRCIQLTDLICINEGEEVIVELANKLDAGADITDIHGTWAHGKDGEIIKNPNRPLLDLDTIAIPDWHLERYVHINNYKGKRIGIYPHNLKEEYPIMTQRGCPFSCSFCGESRYQDLFGKKGSLRRKCVDSIIEELLWAKQNLAIKSILFYDPVFTVNPRWLKEFLPRYKAEIGLPFWCYTYPTTHTMETLHLLKDAGMISITMGVQSGSARILKEHFNRPTEVKRVLQAADEIISLGPEVKGFFEMITKVPFETEEDLRATFEFMMEMPLGINIMGFGEMTNFPTYDFTREVDETDMIARQQKILTSEDYDYYHKLYLLTRSDIPRDEIRAIANDPKYRKDHHLLDRMINNTDYISFTGISF
ncbi:MAG TPA: radical SAM protein [Pseudomonadales bacterium]|nr:radical SAM protein [Pseudomonadales bacterium]